MVFVKDWKVNWVYEFYVNGFFVIEIFEVYGDYVYI